MAIDIRATVTCSLGTLISASINDEYVQDTGLIKCTGTCELSGVYTPAIGTAVTFSYTQGGVTRQVPRKLRVLSSFADPFRRTTSVSLGCKLKYLENLQEPVDWTAYDDEDNAGLTTADAEIITIPIRAKSVMKKCLEELGITASSNPLTNKFSVEKFDLSGGYVSVLSDLLVSESYCGYLDSSEVLQVFSLDQEGGTGPVVDSTKLIDLGPINVGELPGEAVTVSYSTLKLKQPDSNADNDVLWEKDENTVSYAVAIAYSTNGTSGTRTFNIIETTLVTTTYTVITDSDGKSQRVVEKREEEFETQAAAIAGAMVQQYLENGIAFGNVPVIKKTTETYAYDAQGRLASKKIYVEGSPGFTAGGAGVDFVFSNTDYVTLFFGNTIPLEAQEEDYFYAGDYQKTVTKVYGPWARSIPGQQSIAAGRASLTNSAEVASYLGKLFDPGLNPNKTKYGLSQIDYRVEISRKTEGYKSPSTSDTINSKYADGGNSNNGWRTDSTAELELALGSATAQRRIEFSMPYAPDDVFKRSGTAPNYTYSATPSDADEKAKRYGRSQNRLRLGNRSGMNIQMAAPLMPSAPFAPFIVQANGLSALYRTNGTSWQMDANGILASTDALFWSAVGGTGDFWFPVSPTVTTLPTTPPVVNGEMTVTTTVPVWNETVVLAARTSTKLVVTSLAYPLTLLTEAAVTTKTKLVANKITKVDVPLSTLAVAAATPSVVTGTAVAVPTSSVALAAVAPAVTVSTVIAVPLTDLTVTALTPAQAGADGATVTVPLTSLAITAQVPEGVGADLETFYNSWRLQVYGTDAWVFPDWWAD